MENNKYRINVIDMSPEEAAYVLSKNSEKAMQVMKKFTGLVDIFGKLVTLDNYGIYDDDIYKLYKFGCDESICKLKTLLMLLVEDRYFDNDKVMANIGKDKPISFFDSSVKINYQIIGKNNWPEVTKFNHKNIENYSRLAKSFDERYEKAFGQNPAQMGEQ